MSRQKVQKETQISLDINCMIKVAFQTDTERMEFSGNDVGTIGSLLGKKNKA